MSKVNKNSLKNNLKTFDIVIRQQPLLKRQQWFLKFFEVVFDEFLGPVVPRAG